MGGQGGASLVARQGVSYLLTCALLLIAVQPLGGLFLAPGGDGLLLLCLATAVISAPILASPLSDWHCWLLVQLAAIGAAVCFANCHPPLAQSLAGVSRDALILQLPPTGPFHGGILSFNRQDTIWALLLLLGMLTCELTWGVLWLTLRAGYPWAAIVMAGATLLTSASVGPVGGGSLPIFLAVALALVLWHTWAERLTSATQQATPLLARGAACGSLLVGCCMLLVLPLAWSATPPSSATATRWSGEQFGQIWATIRSLPLSRQGETTLGSAGFGSTVRMDGPFRPHPGTMLRIAGTPPALQPYWRGLVYDRYTAQGWQSDATPGSAVPPGTSIPANVPRHPERRITVRVREEQPAAGLLLAPGRPVLASVASMGAYSGAGSGSEPEALYASAGQDASREYRVTAELPLVEPHLDAIGPPPELRYTGLPLGLDPSIGSLARRLTIGSASPLAAARAIQGYLRSDLFSYDTEVGAPPAGQDPLSYFLFGSHRGYCVHFATAMVVLARAAGLPARMASGYVTGHREGLDWVVEGSDAHAWPEIFFAGNGWVPFEPTPGYSVTSGSPPVGVAPHTPAAHQAAAAPAPIQTVAAHPSVPVRSPARPAGAVNHSGYDWPAALIALAGAAMLAGTIALLARRRREPSIGRTYHRLCRTARWLAVAPQSSQTPHEFARGFAGRQPGEHADVERITTLYAAAIYGNQVPTTREIHRAALAMRRLRRRWLARRLGLYRRAR